MGNRARASNFHKRFGNPPRITMRPVRMAGNWCKVEQERRIVEAYGSSLKELLGREPADVELWGNKPLEGAVHEKNYAHSS